MSSAGGAAAKRTATPRQTKKRLVEAAEPKQDNKRKPSSAGTKAAATVDKATGKVRSADSAAAETLANFATQPEAPNAEGAAATAAPEEEKPAAVKPEAPQDTPQAVPQSSAPAAAAEPLKALEAKASPPHSTSGTHEAWPAKTAATTVSAAAASMPAQDFAGIMAESAGQDGRLDQQALQYSAPQFPPQPIAVHTMDSGYPQPAPVQGHNVTVRPNTYNAAAKPAVTPTMPAAGPGAEPETTQWYGCVKHRLVTPHAPARTVELFSAHAYLPYAIAERLPRSIFLDDLATRDQVMLSGRHLRVSFQLGPLSDKQREKLQGLAAMKAVGIARLQQCSLVVVPEADRELATGQPVAMTVFVLVDF